MNKPRMTKIVFALYVIAVSPLCFAGWFSPSCADLIQGLARPTNGEYSITVTQKTGVAYQGMMLPKQGPVFSVAYEESGGKRCHFSFDAIATLLRTSDKTFDVKLKNDKTFTARYTEIKNWPGMWGHPFSIDNLALVDAANGYQSLIVKNFPATVETVIVEQRPATEADIEWRQREAEAYQLKQQSERKAAEERRAAEAERKAKDEERQALAREAAAQARRVELAERLPRVKMVGQKVCQDLDGIESVYAGVVILGQPQYRKERRQIRVAATTEQAQGNRILARVSSIRSADSRGETKYITELPGDPTFQTNLATWDDAEKWGLCD